MFNLENTFWSRKHPLYDEYKELYDELVPSTGAADTIEGELLRAVSNIYYDHYNNGSCNAKVRMSEKLMALRDQLNEAAQKQIEFIHKKLEYLDESRDDFFYMDDLLSPQEVYDYEVALEDLVEQITDFVSFKLKEENV